ncbi:hypothetical protein CDCA_CDCA17G4317 [Cyanidium caldarium]|uniref:Transcription elongation factor SPT5 n=1 Tax=Cyanidium caldarium TaxID=2771 RepID=A0AAV9J119_CYACA|nr:hypothetical protein CDCA_CDCA17G4317 [Cyanidium caldarium]
MESETRPLTDPPVDGGDAPPLSPSAEQDAESNEEEEEEHSYQEDSDTGDDDDDDDDDDASSQDVSHRKRSRETSDDDDDDDASSQDVSHRKRSRETSDDDDEDEDEDDETQASKRRRRGAQFLELEAEVDEDEEDEDEEDDGHELIADRGDDRVDDEDLAAEEREALARREQRRREQALLERQQDVEDLERYVHERYGGDEVEQADGERGRWRQRHRRRGAAAAADEAEAPSEDESAAALPTSVPLATMQARGAPLSEIEQQSLLPTVHDPKLFMVKCKVGKEKQLCICLLQKAVDCARAGSPLAFTAVVAPDHLRGALYVEAQREADVRTAIQGMHLVYQRRVQLVPIKEMVDVLTVRRQRQQAKLVRGQWVRLRRGLYAGDLAQVYEVREEEAVVKLVPRVDLRALARKARYGGGDGEQVPGAGNARRGTHPRRQDRPPPRLLDKAEVTRVLGINVFGRRDPRTGEWFDEFDGDNYKFGLLYKTVPRRGLVHGTGMEAATVEELEPFQVAELAAKNSAREGDHASSDGDDDERGAAAAGTEADAPADVTALEAAPASAVLAAAAKAVTESSVGDRVAHFRKGDRVRVVGGDLRNLTGAVESVLPNGKVLLRSDAVSGDGPSSVSLVQVLAADLEKHFTEGAHVRITAGPHAGLTGMVVALERDRTTASVLADVTGEVLSVSTMLLTDSSGETSAGTAATLIAGGLYRIFDLVVLHSDPHGAGVILSSTGGTSSTSATARAAERITLLTEHGTVRTVSAAEIRGKRSSSSSSSSQQALTQALDSRNQPVRAGDAVRIVGSRHAHRERQGTVLHVFGSRLFVRVPDVMEHAGVVVCSGAEVVCLSGGAAADGGSTGWSHQTSSWSSPFASGLGGPVASSGLSGGRRDALLRQTVVVVRGPHKGLAGRVMDATDTTVRLELESSMRTITIGKDKVRRKGDASAMRSGGAYGNGDVVGGLYGPGYAAPHGIGGRTPLGGYTPQLYGRATPAAASTYGNITPSHWVPGGGVGGATPAAASTYGNFTPSHWVAGGGGRGNAVPAMYGASGAATPMHPSGLMTPAHDFGGAADVWRPMTPAVPAANREPERFNTGLPPAPPTPEPTAVPEAPAALRLWVGCQVRVRSTGDIGTVNAVHAPDQLVLQVEGAVAQQRTVSRDACEPVRPDADDALAVLAGDFAGTRGVCVNVDEDGDCMFREEGTGELRVVGVGQVGRVVKGSVVERAEYV